MTNLISSMICSFCFPLKTC